MSLQALLNDTRIDESEAPGRHAVAATVTEDASLWATFGGAQSANEFCRSWLAIQCQAIPGARTALLLLEEEPGRYATAAAWPDVDRDLTYLASTAERALRQRKGLFETPDDEGADPAIDGARLAYPIDIGGQLMGVAVLDVGPRARGELVTLMRQVHWGVGWLETLFRRRQAEETAERASRTAFALDVLAGASEHKPLRAAALDVVDELAVRLNCRRASLGLVRRSSVRLEAISHSAVFNEKAHVVSTIENAMEEALDQRATVCVPEIAPTQRRIAIAHHDLARTAGAQSLVSVVLTSGVRPVGVLTLERDRGDIFDARTVQLLEAVAVLLGPMFEMKAEANRLIAGRAAGGTRSFLANVLGPGHPTLKIAAALAVTGLTVAALAHGDLRVSSKAVVEGAVQRAAVAPFDGYVAEAPVRAGDVVRKGQLLAKLDDQDLQLEKLRWRSDYEQQVLKYNEAMGKHDRAATRIAQASEDEARSQISLAEDKLARTSILAPFAAIVVSGDLSQMIGSPIEKGKTMFELAPLDAFRVALNVDERDIALVSPGQTGEMVLTGLAGEHVPFTVKTVTPVATSSEGHTFFRVEASVSDDAQRLRPGMEGIGKVVIGDRPLWQVWTRPIVDWARLLWWKLIP